MSNSDNAKHISQCLQLAMLLEVGAPKPGNVSFNSSFEKTRVEHFLASAVASGPSLEEAARRGNEVASGKLEIGAVGVGKLIRDCIADIDRWQHGGNTVLGTVMLFMPLAVAAGVSPWKEHRVDLAALRKNLDLVTKATAAWDSVYLYEAVGIANPSGLGESSSLDVKDPKSREKLLAENVGLYQVFKIGSEYDDICFEWVNNYKITFDLSYPYLKQQLETKPLNTAILSTFLKILSERPDTFIARKVGKQKALEISHEAKKILEIDLDTEKGKQRLSEFDKSLRSSGNSCNPGTTADLTAAALALCTLNGFRP